MARSRRSSRIKREIEAALGEVPPFLAVAESAPELLEGFWQQHRAAYLDSPLPAVFKEKVAASLARFCRHLYPLIAHACALHKLGVTAGEILLLLERPIPSQPEVSRDLWHVLASAAPLEAWPEPGSALEDALLLLSIEVYLGHPQAEACRNAVRRLLGPERYPWWASLLAHARAWHQWVELHPELRPEEDREIREHLPGLLEQEPRLGELFRSVRERSQAASRAPRPGTEDSSSLERSERRLMLLAEAAGALLPSPESGPVVPAILDLSRRLIDADAYAVWRRETGGTWRAVADLNLPESFSRSIPSSSVPLPETPLVIEDVADEALLVNRQAVYEREGIRSLLCVPLCLHGEYSGTITFYYRQPHRFEETEIRVATALANLAASAITTDDLYAERQRIQAEAETARKRLAFLAEASSVLASSLEYETTLEHVARLIVPQVADWCMVHLATGGEAPRLVALEHADPAKVAWARALQGRYPDDPDAPRGIPHVLRTGETELYAEITDKMLVAVARDPEHLQIMREVGFTSCIIAPLCAREQVLGAITLISAESGVRYDEKSVALVEDLARRAATAIDNARLYREAQQALEAMSRSEARLRRLVASNILGVAFSVIRGPITEANDALLDLVGYTREEIAAGPVDWAALTPPEHHARDEQAIEEMLRAGICTPYEKDLLRKDGTRVPVLVGAARIEESPDEAVAFVLDLTERRRLQQDALRLAAIVESSEDPIIGKSLEGIITSWNRGAEQMYGYSAAEAIGQPITMLTAPGGADELPAIMERLKRGERISHYETVRVRKDGSRVDVSLSISPVRDATGAIVGASKIARDISEQKALREELQQRVADLAAAHRRKDEFLAMLAHELRNPLGAISNAVRLLEMPQITAAARQRALQVLHRQVQHQAHMVDDLLDVSRLTRGLAELRRERVDLVRVVQETVEDHRAAVEQGQLGLSVELPPRPQWVVGDATRLAQIVSNLLSNALKFTEAGGRVTVRVEASADGARALVSVQDTGIGIEPELLPDVFESFSQGDRSLARSRGGLGLGLAIVRGLVELHGGEVSAHSEGAGRGTTFTFALPLQLRIADRGSRIGGGESERHGASLPSDNPQSAIRNPQSAEQPPPSAGGTLRILVVEDNRDAAETLRDLLELEGHHVEIALTGPEGVQAGRRYQPDVVLCDIGLPGMDGYGVAAALRSNAAVAPKALVAMTGYAQEEDRKRSHEAGFDYHVVKPVDPNELARLLGTLAGRW